MPISSRLEHLANGREVAAVPMSGYASVAEPRAFRVELPGRREPFGVSRMLTTLASARG